MAFHSGTYDVWLLVTEGPAPWMRTEWPKLARRLDPVVAFAEPPAAVRTYQYGNGSRPDPKFGKLGWDARSHALWALDAKADRTLLNVELWAPGWTRCVKRGRAPDVFFALQNPRCVWTKSPFSAAVVLAVARTLGDDARAEAARAVKCIAGDLRTVLRVHRRCPWGRSEYGGFTDAINDLLSTGSPFREGWERAEPVKLATWVKKSWKRF